MSSDSRMRTSTANFINRFVQIKKYIMKIISFLICTCLFISCQNQEKTAISTFNIKINSGVIKNLKISKYDVELEKMIPLKILDKISSNVTYTLIDPFSEPSVYVIEPDIGKEIRVAVEKAGIVNIQLGDKIDLNSEVADVSDFQQSIQKLNNQYFAGMMDEFDKAMKEKDQLTLVELEKRKNKLLPQFIGAMENSVKQMGASALAFDALPYFDMNVNHDFILEMAERFYEKYPDSEMSRALQTRISNFSKLANGKKAPKFNATTLEGYNINLANFNGKYVLVDFWATWCRPCRLENPKLVGQYEKFNKMGFEILNISIDKDSTRWKEAIKKDGLLSHQQILDADLSIYKLYSLSTLPSNFLLDPNGRIIAKNISAEELDIKLSTELSEIN